MSGAHGGSGALLDVRGIAVDRGQARAVSDVSLRVAPGELVAVVGANGAGKSTTLRAISGLEPLRGGSITFEGEDLAGLSPDAVVARGIAHVPEGRRLFPQMTVRENLLMGAFPRRARAERHAALDDVTGRFPRLADRFAQRAGTLSGGEQQQLAIGRALMARPRLLLLDEPSLALDPRTVRMVFATIDAIVADGIALLLVEQNVVHALQRAVRGYVLEGGRTVQSGPGPALIDDPVMRDAYLGA